MFIFVLFLFCFRVVESRVFCQDSNALLWKPHGFSCPVQCASVIQAIVKLQYIDYEKIIRNEIGYKDNGEVNIGEIKKQMNSEFLRILRRNSPIASEKRVNIAPITANNNIMSKNYMGMVKMEFENNMIENKWSLNNNMTSKNDILMNAVLELTTENYVPLKKIEDNLMSDNIMSVTITSDTNMAHQYGNCWSLEKFEPIQLIIKLKRVHCTRKTMFDERLLAIMTNILNRYVGIPFQFNKEITEIILMKLLNKNSELRYNIIDVNQFIKYLERAIKKTKSQGNLPQIVLKPKHCLTLSLSGCFCKSGFVESNGQCVRPSDCDLDATQLRYLSRIIVN